LTSEGERRRQKRRQGHTVTAVDVARHAGVSTASVSRVLNDRAHVRSELRQRVLNAAEELGYLPHAAGRALASEKTQTIGAVVPTVENQTFGVCVSAVQQRLDDSGYTLLLAESGYDLARETRQVRNLLTRGVDGLILVGGEHAPQVYEWLSAKEVPYVETFILSGDPAHPCVGFDNRAAARRLAEYLLDLGHRRFGVIAGLTRNNDRAAERVAGFRDALAARGVALAREHLIERPYKIFDGQLALRALMHGQQAPTAILCGNDLLAFGALAEAHAGGVRVPRDLSVAGFDDIEFAAHVIPPLTTMQVPAAEIGWRAADYLLGAIGGATVPPVSEVHVALIVRRSTGPSRLP